MCYFEYIDNNSRTLQSLIFFLEKKINHTGRELGNAEQHEENKNHCAPAAERGELLEMCHSTLVFSFTNTF